ncbi:Phage-related holin (Lysis protein) [Enterococcus casseliflavus]|uniref:phage holin family protein n=1 Tax=Enterococcus TaxID=1350 RepID=UPI000DFA4681|nr:MULTISPECIES: phage holin family protein [Enterococcus]GEB28423.1 hypothetical protein ECA02_15180 [Enterococcus casseliflavus]STP35042.1 Phage-related holin (Lysis protein) [Enterococcus casseliflavus]
MIHLFGGSLDVIDVYLTLVVIDLILGYFKALKTHSWMSALNLEGLFSKFIALATIFAAASLDKVAPIVGISLPINIALVWTVLLIIYEISSVLENAYESGIKVGFLQKWLAVFKENVHKESTPADYGNGQSETENTIYQHKDQDQSKG